MNPSRMEAVFEALQRSEFRRRTKLGKPDRLYLRSTGLPAVMLHAADFIAHRLAPAVPVKDGMQTPMRGHPVFTAQHATATCCRRCLSSWHQIPAGRELTQAEQEYILAVLRRWLEGELDRSRASDDSVQLMLDV